MTHIGLLPNRNPVHESRSQFRIDPYWDGMWSSSSASWWQRDTIERMTRAGLFGKNLWANPQPKQEALLRAFRHTRRPGPRIAAVAAANLWRTMTFEQLAAITGRIQHSHWDSNDVHMLYSAGLLDVGKATLPGPVGVPMMVRPSSKGDWAQLESLVSFDDWVGITSGQDWRWGSQAERHNTLTTELCLRAAELTSVPLVLGEHLCALKVMAPPGVQLTPFESNLAGDGMLVRSDGLRVMVELTVSTARIEQKVKRWADLLMADTSRTMSVIFLFAPHPDKPVPAQLKAIRKAVFEAGHATMSHVMSDVPDRLMVAEWKEWFPARHEVSDEFLRLRAWRASGVEDDDRWQPAECLDPFDVAGPTDVEFAKALLGNTASMLGIPHWLRDGVAGESPFEVWSRVADVSPLPRMEGIPDPPQVRALRAPRRAA